MTIENILNESTLRDGFWKNLGSDTSVEDYRKEVQKNFKNPISNKDLQDTFKVDRKRFPYLIIPPHKEKEWKKSVALLMGKINGLPLGKTKAVSVVKKKNESLRRSFWNSLVTDSQSNPLASYRKLLNSSKGSGSVPVTDKQVQKEIEYDIKHIIPDGVVSKDNYSKLKTKADKIKAEIDKIVKDGSTVSEARKFEILIMNELGGSTPRKSLREMKTPVIKDYWKKINIIAKKWGLVSEAKERAATKPGLTEMRSLQREIRNCLSQAKKVELTKSDVQFRGKLIEVKKAIPLKDMSINFAEIKGLKNKEQAKILTGKPVEDLSNTDGSSVLRSKELEELADAYNTFQDWLVGVCESIILPKLKNNRPYICVGTTKENVRFWTPSQYRLGISRPHIDNKIKDPKDQNTQRAQFGNFGRIVVKAGLEGEGTLLSELDENEFFKESFVEKYLGSLLSEFKNV